MVLVRAIATVASRLVTGWPSNDPESLLEYVAPKQHPIAQVSRPSEATMLRYAMFAVRPNLTPQDSETLDELATANVSTACTSAEE